MDADYTAWASAVAAFSAVVCWTNHLFIVIMANACRNTDLSLAISQPLLAGCRFTAKIGNLFLVLHKCNIWIYFLLLLTQVEFFGTTFYFLESRKFSYYFYFLKSRIFGMYFYFLESSKVIYFWQHWLWIQWQVKRMHLQAFLEEWQRWCGERMSASNSFHISGTLQW